MVLVDVDPGADALEVQFGMELGRIRVGADPEGLNGAVGRRCEANHMGGKRTGRLLVPAERIEHVGQIGEQRFFASCLCQRDRDGGDRFGVAAVDGGTDDRTEHAHAVTASEEREVAVDDSVDEGEQLGLDASMRRRLRVRRVADVVRSAAQDDAGPFGEIDGP